MRTRRIRSLRWKKKQTPGKPFLQGGLEGVDKPRCFFFYLQLF